MRIVHYLNQFFGGLGGEVQADAAPLSREGAVGPGIALQRLLGEGATIVGTVIAGDGRFADRPDETAADVLARIAALAPDVVVAGPALHDGRYGLAFPRVRPRLAGRHG